MTTTTSFAGLLAISALTLAGVAGANPQAAGQHQRVEGQIGGQAGNTRGSGTQNSRL